MNKRQKKNQSRRRARQKAAIRERGRCSEVARLFDLVDANDLENGIGLQEWPRWMHPDRGGRVRCIREQGHGGNHVGRSSSVWFRGRDLPWSQETLDALELERGLRVLAGTA